MIVPIKKVNEPLVSLSDWKASQIRYLGKYRNGYAFKPEDWGEEGKPILRIQNLSNPSALFNRYSGQISDVYLVQKGDILISWSASLGVFQWQGEDAWLNQHIFKANPNESLIQRNYFLWLASWFIKELAQRTHGSTMTHLTWDAFASFPVLVPPIVQQKRIADYLDRETQKIDALIAAKKRLLELLAEKRRSVITHAVTRGLTADVPMKNSGVKWIGDIPEDWKVVTLSFLGRVRTGVAKGRKLDDCKTVQVPYLRVANVQDGYLNLVDVADIEVLPEEIASYSLKKGDVLMNEGGDADKLGRGAVWDGVIDPCLHQNHVFAVRCHSVEPDWLATVTSSDYAKAFFESRAKQSTNLASISSTNLKELPVVLPPQKTQKQIVEKLSEILSQIDSLSNTTKRAIALLQERRTSLISAAVTGQLQIPD